MKPTDNRLLRNLKVIDKGKQEILDILEQVFVEQGLRLQESAACTPLEAGDSASQQERFKAMSEQFLEKLFAGKIKPRKRDRRPRRRTV
jgi:hypothetical protein